ncbi:acyl-CoA dehydrogenase family protein [Pseudonocardia asaccharolytica]|uniref:Acyl-CoA dehydrogenase n=1 Tax=Pseudonocardia asaccharolytica DSM 44247 = NBRC 16224 TaxID=1123024 RepID=A0A511D7D4_9PSEU|nr:acyl-CoA dehydrogenase family protein [Pseudonocardia asaccharolytica]GEL20672.1 acyl-CoA dehydrogenase [Pseudonocardia asaccharolytica DSM 44247 = NBRC 16224]
MAIDFTMSDGQQELQKNAQAFAESVLRPVAERIDRAADGWEAFLAGREAYREMAKAGFTRSFIPAEHGGAGFSMIDFAVAAEELARVDINVPTTLLASGLGLQPIIQYGTPEQKERLLRPFAADGEGDLLASYAFTDVAGGANFDSPDPAGGIQTTARRDGDEWVITGQKHYTTNGTGWDRIGCHLYTVVCRTEPAGGADESLAVIAVPGDVAGITVSDVYDKIGNRGVVTPRVDFDGVRVPVDNLIGEPGRLGKQIVSGAFSWTAALIGAACVGTMRAAFEYALDFARTEKRLGTVPVIEHQNVGFMLADIKMRIEACRYLTWKACHDFDRTGGLTEELPIMTKVYCSEAAVSAVYDCMQVVGIASYTRDLAPLERMMRNAMVFPLYDGGNQGVRRRQLHDILRQPGYDSMLAARGDVPPWRQ